MAMADAFEPEEGLLRRHRAAIVAAAALLATLAIAAYFLANSDKQPARKVMEFTMVKLEPPPPPPPQVQPLEQKMIEQPKMETPEEKPLVEQPKTDAPAKGPLGLDTDAVGAGDAFNLAGNAGGNGLLGGGSRWGWYAGLVQEQIQAALQANPKARRSRFSVEMKIWLDDAGRITRVHLVGTTGDAALDRALADETLIGVRLREPPPKDMPMPIVLRGLGLRPS